MYLVCVSSIGINGNISSHSKCMFHYIPIDTPIIKPGIDVAPPRQPYGQRTDVLCALEYLVIVMSNHPYIPYRYIPSIR